MCDYSLHDVPSRAAKVGDVLVTTTFRSGTTGFSAAGEPTVAVCLMAGTELVFERDVKFRRVLALWFNRLGGTVARFRQINLTDQCAHHDALEFPAGKLVLVTRLHPGQRARVLQLPASSATKVQEEARLVPLT